MLVNPELTDPVALQSLRMRIWYVVSPCNPERVFVVIGALIVFVTHAVAPKIRYWSRYLSAHTFPVQFIVADVWVIAEKTMFVGFAQLHGVVNVFIAVNAEAMLPVELQSVLIW